MENFDKNKSSRHFQRKLKLVKNIPQIFLDDVDKKTLKRAVKCLSKTKKSKKVSWECYQNNSATEARVDDQVKLRCRQLPNVVQELRKSIITQNWDDTATLLMILCHPGLKLYSSIILRTCYILLFNHPKSNLELLQNFVRLTTEYILEEDINKFIKILLTLRNSPLGPLTRGRYIRKTGDYKVTRDPDFEKIT